MLYQTIGWQLSPPRKLYMCDVEKAVIRMRNTQFNKSLPLQIGTWKEIVEWAGCLAIALPDNENVCREIKIGVAFPTVAWLQREWEKFVQYISTHPEGAKLLTKAA